VNDCELRRALLREPIKRFVRGFCCPIAGRLESGHLLRRIPQLFDPHWRSRIVSERSVSYCKWRFLAVNSDTHRASEWQIIRVPQSRHAVAFQTQPCIRHGAAVDTRSISFRVNLLDESIAVRDAHNHNG